MSLLIDRYNLNVTNVHASLRFNIVYTFVASGYLLKLGVRLRIICNYVYYSMYIFIIGNYINYYI